MSRSGWVSKVFTFTSNQIKSADIFATEVKLNYKGKDSFKTLFGGLISILILFVMMVYTSFLVSQILQK